MVQMYTGSRTWIGQQGTILFPVDLLTYSILHSDYIRYIFSLTISHRWLYSCYLAFELIRETFTESARNFDFIFKIDVLKALSTIEFNETPIIL